MSSGKPAGVPVRDCVLRIPDVEPGDMGLVLEVRGFIHDVGQGHWWIVCGETQMYRLPVELNQWASRTDADCRRRFLSLPKVFAFSNLDCKYHVRTLSGA